jgi:large subunit ribosomal protein L3
MCKGLIGKKLGMTSVFNSQGRYVPVTVIQAGPCVVTQIKNEATDGYNALQLGFGEKKASRTKRPQEGHFKKSGDRCFSVTREVPVDNPGAFELGQTVSADIFTVGERVDVTGTSKGRGFSGVIKRHGFHGGKKTHGSHSHRIPGAIGCSATPSKVIKGKKLPGQYGNARITAKNLEVVDIRQADNLILLKGAVPGTRSGLVVLRKLKITK